MESENSETKYNSDESTGSCEGIPSGTDPTIYFKNLDLQFFGEEPLRMLYGFRTLKNECLLTGNPMAHYIEGLLQYFQQHKTIKGLKHLHRSADGNYDNGIYIYGILMLCRGDINERKEYLDRLSWKTSQDRTSQCIAMVRKSLEAIRIVPKDTYLRNLDSMELLTNCDDHNIDSGCEDCYYFRRMEEFVNFISSRDP